MYIQDPIERMEARIEEQISLVDKDNKCPCCMCGKKINVDEMVAISPAPDAPLACWECIDPDGKIEAAISKPAP